MTLTTGRFARRLGGDVFERGHEMRRGILAVPFRVFEADQVGQALVAEKAGDRGLAVVDAVGLEQIVRAVSAACRRALCKLLASTPSPLAIHSQPPCASRSAKSRRDRAFGRPHAARQLAEAPARGCASRRLRAQCARSRAARDNAVRAAAVHPALSPARLRNESSSGPIGWHCGVVVSSMRPDFEQLAIARNDVADLAADDGKQLQPVVVRKVLRLARSAAGTAASWRRTVSPVQDR